MTVFVCLLRTGVLNDRVSASPVDFIHCPNTVKYSGCGSPSILHETFSALISGCISVGRNVSFNFASNPGDRMPSL